MVNAFVAVRELADIGDSEATKDGESNGVSEDATDKEDSLAQEMGVSRAQVSVPKSGNTINLNIQLQLPSDASGEVYDKFFSAMKKHGLI